MNNTSTTSVCIQYLGHELDFDVEYCHEKAEKQTHDHEGCPECLYLVSVTSGGNGKNVMLPLPDEVDALILKEIRGES
jgi:hypothetical protein